jgi:hypothetical protein
MSIAASSILRRAVDLLQDQTSVRWPMHELVRYLNDAQRIVVKARPDTMNTATTMSLVAGARQSLKSATADTSGTAALTPVPSKLIEITRNMAGDLSAVTKVERKMMDAGERGWYNATAAVSIKHFMFDERDPTAFYTYPPALSTSKVEVSIRPTRPTSLNPPWGRSGLMWWATSACPTSMAMTCSTLCWPTPIPKILSMQATTTVPRTTAPWLPTRLALTLPQRWQ